MKDIRKYKYCIGCGQLLKPHERTICDTCLNKTSKKYFDENGKKTLL